MSLTGLYLNNPTPDPHRYIVEVCQFCRRGVETSIWSRLTHLKRKQKGHVEGCPALVAKDKK